MMPRILTVAAVLLLLVTGVASAQTSDLIITEYVEGSGNNKALEIYNGTEDQINLGSYAIDRYSNGATSPTSIPLANVDLGPGDTYVVTHDPRPSPRCWPLADQVDNNLNFNGNDALVLTFGGSQVVDSFGRVGEDPGSYWSCSEGTTAEPHPAPPEQHLQRRHRSLATFSIRAPNGPSSPATSSRASAPTSPTAAPWATAPPVSGP